jgi:hypothetical protein
MKMTNEKKKVGNACRTRGQIRSSKARGSALEYDVHHSLKAIFPNIYLTKQLGFQQQQDVRCDAAQVCIECKRLKGISWNQLEKFYNKLKSVAPKDYRCYVVFQSNHQPALVFTVDTVYQNFMIRTFIDEFNTPFEKHPSTRVKANYGPTEGR